MRHASEATAALRHPHFSFEHLACSEALFPNRTHPVQVVHVASLIRADLATANTDQDRVIFSVRLLYFLLGYLGLARWRCSANDLPLRVHETCLHKDSLIQIMVIVLLLFSISVESKTQRLYSNVFSSFRSSVHLHQQQPTITLALTMKNMKNSNHFTHSVPTLV